MNLPPDPATVRILIIDDNPSIHDDIRKILRISEERNPVLEAAKAAVLGEAPLPFDPTLFAIDSALQGEEGLEMVQRALEAREPYALAFVDMRMPPGWDGLTTITHLWRVDPHLQTVICTAYSDYPWEEMVSKIGKSPNLVILKKPFDNIEVLQLSHALTEKWRLNQQVRAKLADLDRLVRRRTEELEIANDQLRREIAERTFMEQALRQAQKMEAIGQLAAGIAHDFNNILTVILGHVSLLADTTDPDEIRESAGEIRDSADRATSLVRQLLAFSRKQVMQLAPLDLGQVIHNLGEVLRRVLGEHIELQATSTPGLPPIDADLRMMEQIIINLAVNSRDAMTVGGSLAITAAPVELDADAARRNPEARPGRFVCLKVADTGSGISPEILPRIFEPFFTTKETGRGTGLGLASVYGIVKQHSGWIEVESEAGRGTIFQIFFPTCSHERPVRPEVAAEGPIVGGHETILVVEDEPAVRRLAVDILRKHGYRVHEAESGVDALKVFQQDAGQIELLLTDMVMPGGLSGRDLELKLCSQKPALKVIYMTGYSQNIAGMDFSRLGQFNLLTKPFSGPDLLRLVRRTLNEGRGQL